MLGRKVEAPLGSRALWHLSVKVTNRKVTCSKPFLGGPELSCTFTDPRSQSTSFPSCACYQTYEWFHMIFWFFWTSRPPMGRALARSCTFKLGDWGVPAKSVPQPLKLICPVVIEDSRGEAHSTAMPNLELKMNHHIKHQTSNHQMNHQILPSNHHPPAAPLILPYLFPTFFTLWSRWIKEPAPCLGREVIGLWVTMMVFLGMRPTKHHNDVTKSIGKIEFNPFHNDG